MGGTMKHIHIRLSFHTHSVVSMSFILLLWLMNGCEVVSARKLASEDTNYALHKKHEALNGKIIYKNPRNAPSNSCPRDEEAIKRAGRKCLRKCSTDADCLSRRKICICDGICGLSCIKPDRECGDLDNPVFGFVEFNGKLVGAQAKYKCQEGYHLIGQEHRRCQADGTWSSIPPECRENLYCTDPPLISNAKHNGTIGVTRFSVNKTLEYTCDQGYTTAGFNGAKCFLYNNTMQWFGPEMSCEPKTCGDPGEISNGQKDSECYSFSCRLTYNCRPGFKLEGRNTHYCQHDGSWNPKDLPKCKPIQCELPNNPDHGKAHYSSVYYNAVVSYECNYSYMIVGPETRTCGPDMKWTGDEPQCVEINCGSPGLLYNGWLDGTRTNFGATIRFQCNSHMKYDGHPNRNTVCQENGTWSHPLPKCLAGCIVPTIENGRLSNDTRPGSQVPHGSSIRVICDELYELSLSLPPSTCYNSTWTHYPHCHPARCKRLPERPRHGMVIAPRTGHGMRARYRCKDGYRLQGSSTTICNFGNWTSNTPRCKIVYCPFPGYLTNGRVLLVGNMGMYDYRPYVKKVRNNRQIRYECNRGFYLSEGPPGATCIAGRWSPKHLPKCAPKLHPRVQWLKKKKKRSVSLADFLDYLNQTQQLQTQLAAAVSNDAKPSNESQLFPVKSGYDEGREDEIINDGNINVGDRFASDGETHKQVLVSNWLPKGSADAFVSQRTNVLDTKYSETVATQNEDKSNKISDTHHSADQFETLKRVPRSPTSDNKKDKTHKKRNEWKKIGKKASHCEELDTDESVDVEVLRAGRDLNYTYSAGARVRVRCLEGHGLNIGNKTAKCSRGKWKPMKPECVTLPCLVPQTANGHYEFNSVQVPEKAAIPHAEVIKFWCQEGYAVLGSNTLRCWYGEWTVTGKRPQCQPDPCMLSSIEHGDYLDEQSAGDTIEHGTVFTYTCDDGWLVNLPQITCHLGSLLPELPSCVTPAQATHIGHRLPQPMKLLSYSESDVTLGGDITNIDLMSRQQNSCSPPTQIQGTIIFKNGQPLSGEERSIQYWESLLRSYHSTEQSQSYDPIFLESSYSIPRFPDGSEVSFNCISNTMGEKTTWNLRCEDGSWVGQKSPSYCRMEEPRTEDPENANDGNKSCIWKKTQPTVVTFHGDLELTEKIMEFQPGTELVSRCVDIGKYAFVGAVRRRCINGEWDGESPTCFGLNRDYDYSLDRPPTILIRHKDGPIAQTNDGKLLVYPGTQLYLECLWVRRYGTPRWNVTHTEEVGQEEEEEEEEERQTDMIVKEKLRSAGLQEDGGGKYWTGWSTDAMRNPQLEFRLALYTSHVGDSGKYTCTTPTGHSHSIDLNVKRVQCPPLEESFQGPLTPRRNPQSTTTLNTLVTFSCGPGSTLIGPPETKCLPSGKWSASVPRCEKVRCEIPEAPEKGALVSEGPFSTGDVLEVTCDTGYMLVGQPVIICRPDGSWSAAIPKCTQACTYPGIIISGTMSSVKFYYPLHDNVTYTCSSEFELHGVQTITCMEGGEWSAAVPSCLPKP